MSYQSYDYDVGFDEGWAEGYEERDRQILRCGDCKFFKTGDDMGIDMDPNKGICDLIRDLRDRKDYCSRGEGKCVTRTE